jgi:hypothetical protein
VQIRDQLAYRHQAVKRFNIYDFKQQKGDRSGGIRYSEEQIWLSKA